LQNHHDGAACDGNNDNKCLNLQTVILYALLTKGDRCFVVKIASSPPAKESGEAQNFRRGMPMKTASRQISIFRAACSVAALCAASTALAQRPAAAKPDDGEIIVTAQFRDQKLQDVPLSITAVNSALLEARSQTDIVQVAAQAPNVQLTPLGGAFGASISVFIRGVGQNDFNPAYEPGVGLYIDDVYYPTLTGAVFDLLDLDRVEILRGPQGTLTGRNSIGGAIKLYSKRPVGSNTGFVEAAYGSRNRLDFRASADFAIAEGVNGRISGVHKQQKGYVDQIDYGCARPGNAQGIGSTRSAGDCVVAKLGEKNYSGVRASVDFVPSDSFNLLITSDYSSEKRTNSADVITATTAARAQYNCGPFCTFASFTAPPGGQLTTATTQPNTTSFEGWGVSGNATLDLSDSLQIQSITAYRAYRSIWGTDDDFTPDLASVGQGYNDLKHRFFSQELRLNGKIGDTVDYTVGGFISDQLTTYLTRQDIRYIVPGLNLQFLGDDPVKAKSKAIFGTVIVKPTDGLTLTGGLRYTDESKSYTFLRKTYDRSSNAIAFGVGALDGFVSNYSGNKLDWRLSADYRFSPAVLAYVTAGTGFKGGGVSARPFTQAQARLGNFGPETVTAYEVGLKTDLLDRTLRINLSAFYNDYKKIQLPLADCTAFGGGPCGVRQNAGDATFKGIELEINARPIPGLDFDGSLSYLDTKWKPGSLNPAIGASININDPVATPKWKWSVGMQYKADLGSAGSITPRIDVSYNGSRFGGRTIAATPFYFGAYSLANARLTWRNVDDDLSVSLEAQNLFDAYYTTARFDAVYAFTGTAYSTVGRPREFAISVKKKF
jgi:iron complex outermembrane recepter protein